MCVHMRVTGLYVLSVLTADFTWSAAEHSAPFLQHWGTLGSSGRWNPFPGCTFLKGFPGEFWTLQDFPTNFKICPPVSEGCSQSSPLQGLSQLTLGIRTQRWS